jgi:hypothetical protein
VSAPAAHEASSPTSDCQAERAGPLTRARAFAVVMGGPLVAHFLMERKVLPGIKRAEHAQRQEPR